MKFALRPATLSDIDDIRRIGREADDRFAAAGHPELADGSTIPRSTAEQAIAQRRITVAEVEGRVVGWVYVGQIEGELCIGQISVAVPFGRCGVGSALLTDVIDQARARSEASIVLNTQDDVPWNRSWFERHGFTVIARDQWSPGLKKVAADQVRAGLDWSHRVHMRLRLA